MLQTSDQGGRRPEEGPNRVRLGEVGKLVLCGVASRSHLTLTPERHRPEPRLLAEAARLSGPKTGFYGLLYPGQGR